MLLQWDDKYSVKNYLIDEQHKKLFELANMADNMIGKQTDPAEIKKMLVALFDYMKTHFRDEEAYMESIQYPSLELHKERHKQIVFEMTNLVKNMKYDFKQQLVIIMEQWLLKHILQEDMEYAKHCEEMNEKRLSQKADSRQKDSAGDAYLRQATMETNSKKEVSKGIMHMYTCLCGKTYNIEPDIHIKIQGGDGVKCPDCTTFIKYITDITDK